MMPPTRSFRETIKEQLPDFEFRRAFLHKAVTHTIGGDLDTARLVLREYVNGSPALWNQLMPCSTPKSLMRMLSPSGNPHARNLFEIVAYLQKVERTVLEVHVAGDAAA